MNTKRYCIYCEKELPTHRWKYCSYECRQAFLHKKWLEANPLQGKSTATTGAISELRVAVDLLSKGYDVFRALSSSSPCDLAVLKDNKLTRIEVRTAHISASGKPFRVKSKRDNKNNIDIYAWVMPDKIFYEDNSSRTHTTIEI